ncbi:MAG TPA: hypothetical protein VNC82_18450 [Candidatus Limnocylindria bacterium]|nr:hypothetical protein [Candidatus Limnocylindria bacterium]
MSVADALIKRSETRYTMLAHSDPDAARPLVEPAQEDVHAR